MIKISATVTIPEHELIITASRSSGPGGQNVNKVATKVTLRFDLAGTASLTAVQKFRVRQRLKNIINSRGCLVIHEESTRSQSANRKRAIEKLTAMLAQALKTRKKRVPTGVSPAQKKKRLEEKKIMAKKKAGRRRVADEE